MSGDSLQDGLFAPVVEAFADDPYVTCHEKVLSSKPLKVRGKIFAIPGNGDLVLKLPKHVVDELVSTGQGTRFDPGHGRLMKEWVVLTIESRKLWVALARQARTFVGG
jgi:hypothetical protein